MIALCKELPENVKCCIISPPSESLVELNKIQMICNRVDRNLRNKQSRTVLQFASEGDNLGNRRKAGGIFSVLFTNVDNKANKRKTAIIDAQYIQENFEESVASVVEEGADINAVDNDGNNIAFYSVFLGKSRPELEQLVKSGVNWNIRNNNGMTVMHLAAEAGNLEALKYFKFLGAEIEARNNHGATPLLRLCYANKNFQEILKWFVEEEANINATEEELSNNLLFLSTLCGRSKDDLEQIVKYGGNYTRTNKDGMSVLHYAAFAGNLEALQYFKDLGMDLEAKDNYKSTPLLRVSIADKNFPEMLTWFVNHGADINAVDINQDNLAFLSITEGRSREELEQVVNTGINWNTRNKNGKTVLHVATEVGNIEALKYFKSLGADLNAKDKSGNTPMTGLCFSKKNFSEMLNWFVEQGVYINAKDKFGRNLLFNLIIHGKSKDELEQVVKFGKVWNTKDKNDMTVMHYAAMSGNIEALEYFANLGADLEARDSYQATPFLRLSKARRNLAEMLDWLITQNADINAVDSHGNNLVFLSVISEKCEKDLKLIVNTGVNWNTKNKNGKTVMHLAAERGNLETLRYFNSLGANLEAKDGKNETPLLLVPEAKQNFLEVLAWFVEQGANTEAVDNEGNNLVFLSILAGKCEDELEQVVNLGFNWNHKNYYEQTVLHVAVKCGNISALKYFKDLGAYLEARDEDGDTPFLILAHAKKIFKEMLNWFVERQVNLNAVNTDGYNLVILSVLQERPIDQIKLLVNYGVDWSWKCKQGRNVLHFAAMAGSVDALEYFKALGVNFEGKDDLDSSPLHYVTVAEQNFREMLEWFVAMGADLNVVDREGNNLLFLAVRDGKTKEDIEHLVTLGCDWKIKNKFDQNLFDLAVGQNDGEVLKYLKLLGLATRADKNCNAAVMDNPTLQEILALFGDETSDI